MAITVEQDVAYKEMPAGTDWVFTISSTNYAGNYKFKYIADLWIDVGNPGALSIRLKFSPNSTGNGIIDISKILEQYVSSDNLGCRAGGTASSFKGTDFAGGTEHPIQLIDKLSLSTNNVKRLTIRWGEEYSPNDTDAPTEYPNVYTSSNYLFWNAVAYNNEQSLVSGEYGINLKDWNNNNYINNGDLTNVLTDASADKQYIGDYEYATLSVLNGYFPSLSDGSDFYKLKIFFYEEDGSYISNEQFTNADTNGGYYGAGDSALTDGSKHLLTIGVGTANMRGAGITIPANWGYYIIKLLDSSSDDCIKHYRYDKRNTDCKGFEKIRLTWLNKYGVWDYYTFTKKNTRSTNITRAEYSKIKGNWNGATFSKYGFNRGRGVLSTSATETMSLNSDWFANDEEAAWIEQLFISPEVYILNDYDFSDYGVTGAEYGKYLTPVIITSKNYDRYSRANDKVAQYEIELEYSINKRVQRA